MAACRACDLLEPRAKRLAELVRAGAELGLGDRVEDDGGRGAGDGVAAERAAEPARAGRVHDLGSAGDRSQRQPAAERLPGHEQVGCDTAVLDRPHRPRPPHPGLHLVGDEEDPVPVAELAQPLEIVAGHGDEAALALHRLEHDTGDASRPRPRS